MVEIFKCGVCGKEYADLKKYVDCVTSCAAEKDKKDKEKELKRIVDGIDYRLKEFKNKFPKEYKEYCSSLSDHSECNCGDNCKCGKNEDETEEDLDVFVKIDATNETPKVDVKLNGKPVDKDEALKILENHPGVMPLTKFFFDF